MLFNTFINDWDAGLEGLLSKFADDTKLAGAVDSLKGRETLKRDFDKLEDWAITNHMKFNKGKCKILHLGWGNPGCLYTPGNERLESCATERDLGVLTDGKLDISQQCSGSQEGQLCPGGHQKDTKLLEGVQRRAMEMVKGLEQKLCEKQLRSLVLFSLEKRRLRGNLIAVCKFFMRGRGGADTDLFSMVTSDKTQGNGLKLCQRRLRY
ncbi:hypothetical protein BTVI_121476 [Pitangus sulphuratus]|nr:hypothetical protein BTVI_121476 [Pitangus sulphuratus]